MSNSSANAELISPIFGVPLSNKYKYIICYNATLSQGITDLALYSDISCTNGDATKLACHNGRGGVYDWCSAVYLITCNGSVTLDANHSDKAVAIGIW